MKQIIIRLDEQEWELVKVVSAHPKFRSYKDPKTVYMNAITAAVNIISR
jgi:hypothetical protein